MKLLSEFISMLFLFATCASCYDSADSAPLFFFNTSAPPKYKRLNIDDAAVLFVDFQTGLQSLVQDYEPNAFQNSVRGLAEVAKYFELPIVITTSRPDGPNGPLMPEIADLFPDEYIVERPGEINAWDNEEFVNTVKATGRKQLIVGGIVTEVCVAFLALSLVEAGYDVFVVSDASGTFNPTVAITAHHRMAKGGAQLLNLFAVGCELARDWRTDLEGLADLFSETVPLYKALITTSNAFSKK